MSPIEAACLECPTVRERVTLSGTGRERANASKRVLAIADDTTVTVIELATSEILSAHQIEPTKSYWRNEQRAPGH